MNKYEELADRTRKSALRSSIFFGMAGVALALLLLVALGSRNSAPSGFWSKTGIVAAILLLLLRQVQRQLRRKSQSKRPRAAEPDPQSRLHLND
ncbi:MAG TPA: hypothetical protein VLJ11_03410 [Bryobacteraceae bacterium]|nr:hypothetical protein [Bryobacteraceae bacterium]